MLVAYVDTHTLAVGSSCRVFCFALFIEVTTQVRVTGFPTFPVSTCCSFVCLCEGFVYKLRISLESSLYCLYSRVQRIEE